MHPLSFRWDHAKGIPPTWDSADEVEISFIADDDNEIIVMCMYAL